MKPYLALLSARFRMLLQYRAAALAGCTTQLFWGGIRMMVLLAFYENAPSDLRFTSTDVVAYIWLGQAFLGLFPYRIDGEMAEMIRTGNVAYELLRPVDLYSMWFVRSLANRSAPTLLRATPLLVIAAAAGWLPWPGWGGLAAFCLLMLAAVLVSSAFTMLMNISMFWTVSGIGVNLMMSATVFLLSGMLVPLPFFPECCQTVLNVLPFRMMADAPFRMFSGNIPLDRTPELAAFAGAWIVGLIVIGRWLLAAAARRLVVQGG